MKACVVALSTTPVYLLLLVMRASERSFVPNKKKRWGVKLTLQGDARRVWGFATQCGLDQTNTT